MVNQTLASSDSYRPDSIDSPSDLARALHARDPDRSPDALRAWAVDFSGAYNRLGIDR